MQQYIQHLILERIPKAASYHANALHLEKMEKEGDEGEEEEDVAEVKYDLDTVINCLLTI